MVTFSFRRASLTGREMGRDGSTEVVVSGMTGAAMNVCQCQWQCFEKKDANLKRMN